VMTLEFHTVRCTSARAARSSSPTGRMTYVSGGRDWTYLGGLLWIRAVGLNSAHVSV